MNDQEQDPALVGHYGKKKRKNKGNPGSEADDDKYQESRVKLAPKRSARDISLGSEADISGNFYSSLK